MNQISPRRAEPDSITIYVFGSNLLIGINYRKDKIRSHVLRVFKFTTVGVNTYMHT